MLHDCTISDPPFPLTGSINPYPKEKTAAVMHPPESPDVGIAKRIEMEYPVRIE